MKISQHDLIRAFSQKGAGNCVSIALIKAAIEFFGLNNVFELSQKSDSYSAKLKNGTEVEFTLQNLKDSRELGNFQPNLDPPTEKIELYKDIHNYAELCYAVMAAKYTVKNNLQNFNAGLEILNNGAVTEVISQYLGLENYASEPFLGRGKWEAMIAWHFRHTVYMSRGVYDSYGTPKTFAILFPKKIRLRAPKEGLTNLNPFSEIHFLNINSDGNFIRSVGNNPFLNM